MTAAEPRDYGTTILEEDGIARKVALAHTPPDGLPCCTFVAIWMIAAGWDLPVDRKNITSIRAWAEIYPEWWKLANISNYVWTPWDTLRAAKLHLGGVTQNMNKPMDPTPQLTPGHWHVCQDWKPDLSTGHTFLIHAPSDSSGCFRLVQSSKLRGFRDSCSKTIRWPHSDKRLIGVATLPVLYPPPREVVEGRDRLAELQRREEELRKSLDERAT